MIIFPYKAALTLNKPSLLSYVVVGLCVAIFLLQMNSNITEQLLYFPDSWNPFNMLSASFAHNSWTHLIFNLIFFMAFSPALEAIIASPIRYIGIIVFLSFIVSICYSLFIATSGAEAIPTLGLSGVVMGFIGLGAYLMPKAKIRVFFFAFVFWKTFYTPAWLVAICFIGYDLWTFISTDDFHGVNIVAHVAGGFAGYFYGMFFMAKRKQEIKQELDDEIEEMQVQQTHGNKFSSSHSGRKRMEQELVVRELQKADDKLMKQVYTLVMGKRDSLAIATLLATYDVDKITSAEVEVVYKHVAQWGPSRTQLCLGRLIIYLLSRELRPGRALYFIEQCQLLSPLFLLPDLTRVAYFTKMAIELEKSEVAKNLITQASKRYPGHSDLEQLMALQKFLKE